MMNPGLLILSVIPLALAACATTREYTSEERAYCENMERRMGSNHVHDHSAVKSGRINPMNVTHSRCRKMLGLN